MKRIGNLISQIADLDNLYTAFYKAAKTKRGKSEVLIYESELDNNLIQLQSQILLAEVNVGNYNYFKIYDPKERTICAASFAERVLHHAIMNVCHDIFEKKLIFHTYATRTGKGTYAALDKAKIYIKKYQYCAKLDVRKYFDSISHDVLKKSLANFIKDTKLLSIFETIINSYKTQDGKGIPIGNLTSQYFANNYLSPADHYAKEQLQIPGYIRYMDDILLFENDKYLLKEKMKYFQNFVEKNLQLTFKTLILNRCLIGVSFLGYHIFPFTVKLNQRSKRRFCEKYRKYSVLIENEVWSQSEYVRHILPLISFTKYANAKSLRTKLLCN